MTPYVDDPDFTLYVGDVLDVLRELPDGSVDCCVTSPPYWGLRDYGTGTWDGGDPDCDHAKPTTTYNHGFNERWGQGSGQRKQETKSEGQFAQTCGKCGASRVDRQIGLEATPELFVARMVEVFREVRRVLAAHGTCWVNLGDSYAGGNAGGTYNPETWKPADVASWTNRQQRTAMSTVVGGLKPKDLCGIPWRVAFALQADGWYLRSDIIWAKPNPMPESVTDRPTKSHEYVFLLTKQPRYFFDAEAVREPYMESTIGRSYTASKARDAAPKNKADSMSVQTTGWVAPFTRPVPQDETLDGSDGEAPRGPDGRRNTRVVGADGSVQHRDGERWPNGGRNIRSVWEIATQPYAEAHFATFPEELPRRCVAAGCPEWVCRTCGKPRERIVERELVATRGRINPDAKRRESMVATSADHSGGVYGHYETETLGWSDCGHNNYRAGVVLDPFVGSGTSALVARKLGRRSIGIELNPEYAGLCARRLQQLSLLSEGAA